MARTKKFNFAKIALNGPSAHEASPTASVYAHGQLVISRDALRAYGLLGKLVEILWDAEHRALGMRIVSESLTPENQTKAMKVLEPAKDGTVKVSIGRLLSKVGVLGEKHLGLPVEKYPELSSGYDIYYVQFPEREASPHTPADE